jgi:hypothetical protein
LRPAFHFVRYHFFMTAPRSLHWLVQSAIGIALVGGLSFAVRTPAAVSAAPQETAVDGVCKAGYIPDADGKCQDVDECKFNNGECDPNVTCTNTAGSRTCGACGTDFVGDGYYGCKDPNDCAAGGCAPVDTRPPTIRTSGSQNVTATSADGAIAKFTAYAIDNIDGALVASCSPKSGSMFAMGPTTVTCTASDKKGNKKSAMLTINVK